jgi:hypothetical protein
MSLKRLLLLALAASLLAACSPPAAAVTDTPPPVPTERPVPSATPGPTPASPPGRETPAPGPDDPVTGEPGAGDSGEAAPWAPRPEDASLQRGQAFLDDSEVLLMESFPVQVMLVLRGSLPTPCHQLRVDIAPPGVQNRVAVEVYSVVDPSAVCVQMLEPFEARVNLGSFPSGDYTVVVNGEDAAEFNV